MPSCPRKTVSTAPEIAVTQTISMTVCVATSLSVMVKISPSESVGRPALELSVIDVCEELVIASASVVLTLLTKTKAT